MAGTNDRPPRSGDSLPRTADACDFWEQTTLQGARPEAVGALKAGDRLDVKLSTDGGRKVVVCVVPWTGDVAGSIAIPRLRQLIGCLEKGVEYEAQVLTVRGGHCEVQVARAGGS